MKINLNNILVKQDKLNILDNINLEFTEGVYGIVGENGAGKSTLLNIINLMKKSKSGEIKFNDQEVNYKKGIKDIKISTVYQFSDLQLFNLTILEDLLYGIKVYKMDIKKAKKEISYYFSVFDLDEELLNKPSYYLSGGEKKKIAIISELILHPDILLLDEPTIGLDSESTTTIINNISKLDCKIIIVVFHDMESVFKTCDRVVELKEGKVVNNLDVNTFFETKYEQNDMDMIFDNYLVYKKFNIDINKAKAFNNQEVYELLKDKYDIS